MARRFRNKRSNRRGRRQPRIVNNPLLQVSRNINYLFKPCAYKNITYNATAVVGTTSTLLSLFTGTDTRFLAFQTILGEAEFTNMAAVYDKYRIINASVIVASPTQIDTTNTQSILHIDVDSSVSAPSNPVNSVVIADDTVKLCSPNATSFEVCKWDLRGIGPSTDFWLDTGVPPNIGTFYIGNNLTTTQATFVWQLKFQLGVEFANPK